MYCTYHRTVACSFAFVQSRRGIVQRECFVLDGYRGKRLRKRWRGDGELFIVAKSPSINKIVNYLIFISFRTTVRLVSYKRRLDILRDYILESEMCIRAKRFCEVEKRCTSRKLAIEDEETKGMRRGTGGRSRLPMERGTLYTPANIWGPLCTLRGSHPRARRAVVLPPPSRYEARYARLYGPYTMFLLCEKVRTK